MSDINGTNLSSLKQPQNEPEIVIESAVWDQTMIEKYNYSGPRYTSYPTAVEFSEQFNEADFAHATMLDEHRDLSLYVHIPFCHKLCYYCGCNKIVTRHQHKADEYLDLLAKEIETRSALFKQREVTQLHLGGGTPTFLTEQQITRLMAMLTDAFDFTTKAEISIEIDPREIELSMLDHLQHEGFNRISIGVQDFNKEVQALVNREQDNDFIISLINHARELGFNSINLDLIYGLPKQTPELFAITLQQIIALQPDRLSIFNYAHLPHIFAAQRKIKDEDLPTADQRLTILQQSIEAMTNAGYQFIGMDHFAKPDDELSIAQRRGELHRNFQGYTTQGEADLLGLGVSSISMIGNCYAQNQKELAKYQEQIESQGDALWKGVKLTQDDKIRRQLIKSLMCDFRLDSSIFAEKFEIDFNDYFSEDLKLLQTFINDDLISYHDGILQVSAVGRLLIRNICMCFDIYFRDSMRKRQFSRVI